MLQVILCMPERTGKELAGSFRHNHPNYTIYFTFSKDLPANPCQFRDDRVWICDRDEHLTRLSSLYGRPLSAAGDLLPLPVIAYSHEGNHSESLMGAFWMICSCQALTPAFLKEVLSRSQGIPLTVAQTGRIMLRELTGDDLPCLLKLQMENIKNPAGCFFPESCARPDQFLKNYIRHQYMFYGYGLFGIFRKEDLCFLGIAGFSDTQLPHTDVQISYALLKEYQTCGYASESVHKLLNICESRWGLSKIAAIIQSDNTPSLKLAANLGIRIIRDP